MRARPTRQGITLLVAGRPARSSSAALFGVLELFLIGAALLLSTIARRR